MLTEETKSREKSRLLGWRLEVVKLKEETKKKRVKGLSLKGI